MQAWFRMRRWLKRRIKERLADAESRDDLLQVLLDARYEDGTPISRRDVITEAMMLVGGGYETVVAALAWTLALLPQNPQAQQRPYDEVDGLGGAQPGYADLDRLNWAKACFDEGQRLQGLLLQPRFAVIDDIRGRSKVAYPPFSPRRPLPDGTGLTTPTVASVIGYSQHTGTIASPRR